jgi:hypothetical protein
MPSDDSSVRDVLSHQSLKVSRDDPGPRMPRGVGVRTAWIPIR